MAKFRLPKQFGLQILSGLPIHTLLTSVCFCGTSLIVQENIVKKLLHG